MSEMSVKIAVTLGTSSDGRANVVVESPMGTLRPSARCANPSARHPAALPDAGEYCRPYLARALLQLLEPGSPR